jgi:hypothetical protein
MPLERNSSEDLNSFEEASYNQLNTMSDEEQWRAIDHFLVSK